MRRNTGTQQNAHQRIGAHERANAWPREMAIDEASVRRMRALMDEAR